VQKDKESRDQTRYDLSLKPKFESSNNKEIKKQQEAFGREIAVKPVNKGFEINNAIMQRKHGRESHEFGNIRKRNTDKQVARVKTFGEFIQDSKS
jgi:hypothetical protein